MSSHTIKEAAAAVAAAVRAEATLRAQRETTLAELTASIIGQHNPETGKPHSATSAREAAKALGAVQELNERILDAECAVILARGDYEAARIDAWLAVREVAA